MLHGDGSPTRHYLFAGDAADAFDTILHKGEMGQIYNVGSCDEISNLALCGKLLTVMDIPHTDAADFSHWVKYTHDRPFNDHRYAVDGSKLRQLGWEQRTTLDDGLRITVDWYRCFGEKWWGDISKVLSPFPIVIDKDVQADHEPVTDTPQPTGEPNGVAAKKRKVIETNGNGHALGRVVSSSIL